VLLDAAGVTVIRGSEEAWCRGPPFTLL
jgi:hypothetical protein